MHSNECDVVQITFSILLPRVPPGFMYLVVCGCFFAFRVAFWSAINTQLPLPWPPRGSGGLADASEPPCGISLGMAPAHSSRIIDAVVAYYCFLRIALLRVVSAQQSLSSAPGPLHWMGGGEDTGTETNRKGEGIATCHFVLY